MRPPASLIHCIHGKQKANVGRSKNWMEPPEPCSDGRRSQGGAPSGWVLHLMQVLPGGFGRVLVAIRNDHLSSGNQYTFNWLILCKVTQRGTGSQWRIARNDEPRGVLTTLWIRRIIVYSWLQEYLCRPLCIRNYEISGAIWSARRITLMRIWSKFFGIWKVWGNVGIALWGTPYVDRSRSNRRVPLLRRIWNSICEWVLRGKIMRNIWNISRLCIWLSCVRGKLVPVLVRLWIDLSWVARYWRSSEFVVIYIERAIYCTNLRRKTAKFGCSISIIIRKISTKIINFGINRISVEC